MADMTPLTDILNNDAANATPVQDNFQTIETYINGTDLVRTDGTEVMAANLDMDSNKVVNLADGVGNSDAVNKGQMDAAIDVLPLGVVAYATKTSDQTGITTTTDVTGLSVTFTASPLRLYRTSFVLAWYSDAAAIEQIEGQIADGSNNRKQSVPFALFDGSVVRSVEMPGSLLETGLSGSTTRKVRLGRISGSVTLGVQAGADYPCHILVEDLGLA